VWYNFQPQTTAHHMRNILSVATLLTLLSGLPSDAAGQILSFEIRDGLVTLDARNVSVWEILQRWATVGDVTFVDGERMPPTPVTLVLTGVSETDALRILLRDASGYIVGRRETPNAASSSIDRVLIVATSTAPRPAAAAPTRPGRFAGATPTPQGQPDDEIADPIDPFQFPPNPGAAGAAPVRTPSTGVAGVATGTAVRSPSIGAAGVAGRTVDQSRPGTISTPTAPPPVLPGAPTGMVDPEGNAVLGPTPVPEPDNPTPPPTSSPNPTGVTRPGTISPAPRTQP
jgi:hypothetical protein